jgi:hypothetical protein
MTYVWLHEKLSGLSIFAGIDQQRPVADWSAVDARFATAISRAKSRVAVVITDGPVADLAHGLYVICEPFANIVVGLSCTPGEVTIAADDHRWPELRPILDELHELSKAGQLAPLLARVADEIEARW